MATAAAAAVAAPPDTFNYYYFELATAAECCVNLKRGYGDASAWHTRHVCVCVFAHKI